MIVLLYLLNGYLTVPNEWLQPKDWGIRMNKKERRLALATALQSATANITIVEDLKVHA